MKTRQIDISEIMSGHGASGRAILEARLATGETIRLSLDSRSARQASDFLRTVADEAEGQQTAVLLEIAKFEMVPFEGTSAFVINTVEGLSYAFALHAGADPQRVSDLIRLAFEEVMGVKRS